MVKLFLGSEKVVGVAGEATAGERKGSAASGLDFFSTADFESASMAIVCLLRIVSNPMAQLRAAVHMSMLLDYECVNLKRCRKRVMSHTSTKHMTSLTWPSALEEFAGSRGTSMRKHAEKTSLTFFVAPIFVPRT